MAVTATDPPRTYELSGSVEKPGSSAELVGLLDYVHEQTKPDAYEIGLPGEKVRTSRPLEALEGLSHDLPGGGILRTAGFMIGSVSRLMKGAFDLPLGVYRGTLRTVEETAQAARVTAEALQGTVKAVEGTAKAVEGTARAVQGTAEAARGTANAVEKTASVVRSGFGLRRSSGANTDRAPARTAGLAGLLQERIQDAATPDDADDR